MLDIKDLELIDFTEEFLELYINDGSIIVSNGKVYINNQDVLIDFIKAFMVVDCRLVGKLYRYIIDPVDSLYYQFIYEVLNGEISLELLEKVINKDLSGKYSKETSLYYAILAEKKVDGVVLFNNQVKDKYVDKMIKYINCNQYRIAYEFLKALGEDSILINVLKKLLLSKEDNCIYILRKGVYPSDVTNDNLHRLEREALVTLETGDILDFLDYTELLEEIYENQDSVPLLNINTLVAAMIIFESDETSVSDRSFSVYMGDFNTILFELLSSEDYYRVDEIIKQAKNESKGFNIYYEMLDIISTRLMSYNRRNTEYIKRVVSTLNTGEKPLDEVVNEYPLSSINGELFVEHEENEFLSNKDNNNYYLLYKKYFSEGEYKEALKALMKLDKRGKLIGYHINIDYLVKELKICISNDLENHKLSKEADEIRKEADELFEAGDYLKALITYDKSLNLMSFKLPTVVAKIAICFYRLGDISRAYETFRSTELSVLYPEHIIALLEIMFKLNMYSKIPKVFARLEAIAPKCNVKIYYMMSIVYIKLHRYNDAREALNIAKELNLDYHNAFVSFQDEYDIIMNCEKNNSDESYSMNDFADYELSEEEMDIVDELDDYRYEYDEGFIDALILQVKKSNRSNKEKIEYLISIIKILKVQCEEKYLSIIYDYLNILLTDGKISKNDQEQFTLAMKNYKKI